MILIRTEAPADATQVYNLVKLAFATAAHADGTEQDLVVRLRNSEAFIPQLSLVAAQDGKLVGHILMTKSKLGTYKALTVAPLAVLPEYQGQGIGTLLLNEGHRIARELGYEIAVLVGHENYYPRVGYCRASRFGITCPIEVPDENFMALHLLGEEPNVNAMVEFAPAFSE